MSNEPFWPWDEGYDEIPDEVEESRVTNCPTCGEPKAAHLRCTCPVRSDAIGPHTRGCPNHPEAAR